MKVIDHLPYLNMSQNTIKRIQLFPNNNEKSEFIVNEVEQKLIQSGFEIVEDNPDLGIAIGGDGSFLRMVKQCNFNSNIYYIGINAGTLGFLQEVNPNEIDYFITSIQNGNFKVEPVGIQETKVITSESQSIFFSLNEIVIRDDKLNTLIMDVMVDDTILERFSGDGILVSTSVGSTAYNLSYGGTIVYNSLHTLQITPIAPLNNKAYRNLVNSFVVPEDKKISFLPQGNSLGIIISIDGENKQYKKVEKIETKVKDKRINCLRLSEYNFTKIVNDKFLKNN